jgi:6-phosphogluconolactonase
MTNDAAANSVVVFTRATNGTLTLAQTIGTGGTGSGALLDSQGAIIRRRAVGLTWVFAANAGSDTITAFTVNANFTLTLVNTVASGGVTPISVSATGSFLYAVNRGSDNISGFTITTTGLVPLAGSTLPLSGIGTFPGQIQFNNLGNLLVVTEENTNVIDTYTVAADGLATGPFTHGSAGLVPFGFAFRGPFAIVSEAGSNAASSYRAGADGSLTVVSATVSNGGQRLPCWVVVSSDRVHAYVANHGNRSVSSYSVAVGGALTLINSRAGVTGLGPEDEALSAGSAFLYVLNFTDGTISGFQVQVDGTLLPIAGVGGLPAGTVGGLAAN